MDFTIVTPSFRQLEHLGCCISSIADQEGVSVEHIVQDAGTEGFAEFSKKMEDRWPDRPGYRRIMISEPDQGMYDAINRGLKKATGSICAYLNSDEQYLPGALDKAKRGFAGDPQAEILYGGFLVVDSKGNLVAMQRAVKMSWRLVATSHLPNFTCATFFRRILLERDQAWFDTRYRFCGDAVWAIERLRRGTKSRILPDIVGIFTETGENQGVSETGLKEAAKILAGVPLAIRLGKPIWKLSHWMKKAFYGCYFPARVSYDLYMPRHEQTRAHFAAIRASPFWESRAKRA